MTWNSFSFLINNEEAEAFLQLNPDILETNLVNILILIGILLYGNKVSFSVTLENRQKEIIQTIENAQKAVSQFRYPKIKSGLMSRALPYSAHA